MPDQVPKPFWFDLIWRVKKNGPVAIYPIPAGKAPGVAFDDGRLAVRKESKTCIAMRSKAQG